MDFLRQPESGTMGPLCSSTPELLKALDEIPTPFLQTFQRSSDLLKSVLASTNNVPVYHTNASMTSMLRISMALSHINKLSSAKQGQNAALIIVDNRVQTDEFDKVLALLREQYQSPGATNLDGHAICWGNIILIKGFSGIFPLTHSQEQADGTFAAAATRVKRCVTRLLQVTRCQGIVWHESAWIGLLDHLLLPNGPFGRVSHILRAVTITGPLHNAKGTSGWAFHTTLTTSRIHDLLAKTTLFNVPVLFVESAELGLTTAHLRELHGFAQSWPGLFPRDCWLDEVLQTFNNITVWIFRICAAAHGVSGAKCLKRLQDTLPSTAWKWADACREGSNYGENECSLDRAKQALSVISNSCETPCDYDTGHLADSLLDPGKTNPTLFAVRISPLFAMGSQTVARISSTSQAYFLVSHNDTAPQADFLRHWNDFVTTMVPSLRNATISRDVAEAWKDLRKFLEAELQDVKNCRSYQNWTNSERTSLERVIRALKEGDMSRICRRTLQ